MSGFANWLLAIRPRTLVISIMPVCLGTSLAFQAGTRINGWLFTSCVVCALLIQIGANLFNDAIDFKKGADTSQRLGPVRVTQAGLIESGSVIFGGALAYAFAILCAIPLVIQGGWIIVLLGVVSLYCGYAYTAEPVSLAYKGLGELFVILFFGLAAVMGTFYVQTLEISVAGFIAGLQTGMLAAVVIAVNNLRDIHQDAPANKKTIAVRFGVRFAAYEIAGLILFPYVIAIYWVFYDKIWAFVLPVITLPLASGIIKRIFNTAPGRDYNRFLIQSIRLFVFFCLLTVFGLFL